MYYVSVCSFLPPSVFRLYIQEFLVSDAAESVAAVEQYLRENSATIPSGFGLGPSANDELLLTLIVTENEIPAIAASICLHDDLSVTVTLRGNPVPQSAYRDLVLQGKVASFSEVVNLMARVKAWVEQGGDVAAPWLQMAAACLESFLEEGDDRDTVLQVRYHDFIIATICTGRPIYRAVFSFTICM